MHPMLNIAIQAANNASRIMLRFLDQLHISDINEKNRRDFVTKADQLCEEEIKSVIHNAYPDHSILAEESGRKLGKNSEYCWVIDPLDGTTNFIHAFPQFAISIALKKSGQTEVALVYDPLRQEMFTATKGRGAHLNNKRIRVSDCKKLELALLGTGFPFKKEERLTEYLDTFTRIFPKSSDVRRTGAASLDLAYVAAGRLDGFWEFDLAEWDIAAGQLLITEAGGVLSDFIGKTNNIHHGNIIAGNKRIHTFLLKELL